MDSKSFLASVVPLHTKIHKLSPCDFLLVLVVLELVEDAIEELAKNEPNPTDVVNDLPKSKARLQQQLLNLTRMEEMEYNQILASNELSATGLRKWLGQENKQPIHRHIDIPSLLKSPALCHTAVLPSDIRYRGILTENTQHMMTTTIDKKRYEKGVSFSSVEVREKPHNKNNGKGGKFVHPIVNRSDDLILVTHKGDHDRCEEPTTYESTFRDAFLVTNKGGPKTLTIPNDSEKQYYTEFDIEKSKGWIFLCFYDCITKCPPEDLSSRILRSKGQTDSSWLDMKVNGVSVSDFVTLFSGSKHCRALKHDDADEKKQFTWTPNEDGNYQIRIDIREQSQWSFLRFSSIILM